MLIVIPKAKIFAADSDGFLFAPHTYLVQIWKQHRCIFGDSLTLCLSPGRIFTSTHARLFLFLHPTLLLLYTSLEEERLMWTEDICPPCLHLHKE